MSWSPEDEDPKPTRRPGYYRNSTSMCDCDNCNPAATEEP